jgi:hypothetical protein
VSERIQPKLLIEGSASQRSAEEQRRLMDEYDNAVYEGGIDEDAYMAAMEKREHENNAAIEARIMNNPSARRMYVMAQHIAELKASDTKTEIISDKEDKLQELLLEYSEGAHKNRDIENRNAEQERDTIKGNGIRVGKQIAAEETFEERMQEIDFILNATNETAIESKPEGPSSAEAQSDKSEDDKPEEKSGDQKEGVSFFDQVAHDGGTSEDTGAQENESREEYEARQLGSRSASTDATDLEILEEANNSTKVTADDLEIIDEDKSTENTGIRVRDWLRHPLASASGSMTGLFGAQSSARAERGGSSERRRMSRLSRGLGAAALLIGGGLLLMKGHDVFGDRGSNGGNNPFGDIFKDIPTDDGGHGGNTDGGEGGNEILTTVRVKPGDGEIKVTQSILEQQGIHVNTTDAQRIGEHANVDLLLRDNNYNDTS